MNYIKIGQEQGAKLVAGGKRLDCPGYFIEATVFTDVTDDMTIAKEEVCFIIYKSDEERFLVIKMIICFYSLLISYST